MKLNHTNYNEYKNKILNHDVYKQDYLKIAHDPNMNCLIVGIYNWHIRNWFRNIRQLFRNLGYAWQRAIYGYAYCDYWDIDMFISGVLTSMLEDLAANNYGYPGVAPYDTPEKWSNALCECAQHLRYYNDNGDFLINEYQDECFKKQEYGKEWFQREREIDKEKEEHFQKAAEWLKQFHGHLWD